MLRFGIKNHYSTIGRLRKVRKWFRILLRRDLFPHGESLHLLFQLSQEIQGLEGSERVQIDFAQLIQHRL